MTVTLNGKEYPLHFTVNALCSLEEKTGLRLDRLRGSSIACLRGLLWCGLMTSQPGLTLRQAGDLLDAHLRGGGALASVSSALAAALEDACFFPKPGKDAPPPSP